MLSSSYIFCHNYSSLFRVVQIPSHFRGIPEESWTFKVDGIKFDEGCAEVQAVDPGQDLMILIEMMYFALNSTLRLVYFLTVSVGMIAG